MAVDGAGAVPSGSPLLADHTTLRVGGPADRLVVATTEAELIEAVTGCDRRGEPVLVVGGGSNLLVADEGFRGTVVVVATRGISADVSACGGAAVRVAAGENWEAFVAEAVAREWSGVEALSGIPGSVGATPIQNVGAYGAEVAQTIASVRTWDRERDTQRTFALSDCGFGYRTSRFKREPGRYLVLEVGFQFPLASLGAPVAYAELARALGVDVGRRAPAADVREAVLALRRGKGMVLDAADHDTWSTGSFFTNPILTEEGAALLPPEAPRYPVVDHTVIAQIDGNPAVIPGLVKTSAAWLIDHAGFGKGYGQPGNASLSTKHVLALTNRGGATATEIRALADEVVAGVKGAWGVDLVPEPVLL